MALYYLESSALIKLYVREIGTEKMLRMVSEDAGAEFAVLTLGKVEIHSAVRKRQRAGDLSGRIADQILDLFETHFESRFLLQHASGIVVETACVMVDRYRLTSVDALHLAAFLSLAVSRAPLRAIFVSGDQQLLRAAEAEGAVVVDASLGL